MIWRDWFLLISLLLRIGSCAFNTSNFNAFKQENGSFVFIRRGTAAHIPDLESLHELGFHESNVTTISNEVLSKMKVVDPIPSMRYYDVWADEKMRIRMDVIAAFDPATYWTDSQFMIGHGDFPRSYNPSMVRIRKDKILLCWRSTDWHAKLLFGWYHHHNHTITPDLGIVVPTVVTVGEQKSPLMDDGRLIMLNRTTVAVIFSGVITEKIIQMYALGTYSDETGSVVFHEDHVYGFHMARNEKNWTPFLYNHSLAFFQYLNPVKVMLPGEVFPTREDVRGMRDAKIFSELPEETRLPWDSDLYGKHVRGGTPAIHVKGKLLALFHTQATFIQGFFTYVFGAITFCPQPPFRIHSMSPVPITKKHLYEGPWDTKAINYVLYPMGLIVDDKEELLHVSLGYQDKHGYMIKMRIDELLASMDVVNQC